MTSRQWQLLIAGALLLTVASLMLRFEPNDGQMTVKLSFLGYTNDSQSVRMAHVVAMNTGTVTVRLNVIAMREASDDNRTFPVLGIPPPTLAPGQSTTLLLPEKDFGKPWIAEVGFERMVRQDQLYEKARGAGNPTVMQVASVALSPPPHSWVVLGPITNRPPDWQRAGDVRR